MYKRQFVLWVVVQWVILFVGRFPRGMWDLVAGYVRWSTRVTAYAFGLVDRYPPFAFDPSLTTGTGAPSTAPSWPCLLYTSDAADDLLCVDLGGRRITKKNT